MAPKNRNTSGTATPISTSSSAILQNPTTPKPTKSSSSAAATNPKSLQATIETLYNNYIEKSDQRTKLLDAFMAFLVIVGAVQFVYCVVAGNYVRTLPNGFLPIPLTSSSSLFFILPPTSQPLPPPNPSFIPTSEIFDTNVLC